MSTSGLPLCLGDIGPSVSDLHQRLDRAGFGCPSAERFDETTEAAVRRFQESRGLDADGVVETSTWAALAEAQHRPGDRLLYHRGTPMLRGDDVADLQRRLGALGFDAGRVDGIFGPETARALENFQRNAGLPTDAICGPDSLAALLRLGGRDHQENVTEVRERDRLLHGRRDDELRIVIADIGGLGAVIDTIGRRLRHGGMRVDALEHPNDSHLAKIANRVDADLYLGLIAEDGPSCVVSYFATDGFESAGGALFAQLLSEALSPVLGVAGEVRGQRRTVLRETNMPAAIARIGPTAMVVERGPDLAVGIESAVRRWCSGPIEGSSPSNHSE